MEDLIQAHPDQSIPRVEAEARSNPRFAPAACIYHIPAEHRERLWAAVGRRPGAEPQHRWTPEPVEPGSATIVELANRATTCDKMTDSRRQQPSPASPIRPRDLLERSDQLSALEHHLDAVSRHSSGRLVLIRGEAGVGKTVLLRQFGDMSRQSARQLNGACDALFTARPLGALVDIARLTGGELAATIHAGSKPYEVAEALMRELGRRSPSVVVLEDLHWADEATLDVLRLLCRRVETVPALVLASFREEELVRTHPLRILLGEIPASDRVVHMQLGPLSAAAVGTLAEPFGVDAAELYRQTAGNPFFVTEVLAAGGERIPHTVRDAVLARAARLSPPARTLLEAVAAAPQQAEIQLLEALVPAVVDRVGECLAAGILVATPDAVAFRHELSRLAIEESVPPDRRIALHRGILGSLSEQAPGMADPARLAYHAEAAGDADAVLRLAPVAAERAASLGAHREAASQYARAIRFAGHASPRVLADLLDRRAYACYLTGQFAEAIEAQESALGLHRRLHDQLREGDALRSLSRLFRYVGRVEEAGVTGRNAVSALAELTPGRELAMAFCNLSHLRMNAEDAEEALAWGARALELAEQLGDEESVVYAGINIATVNQLAGEPGAVERLERIAERADSAGLEENAGRAYVALSWWAPRDKSYARADRHADAGLEYCIRHGLDLWRLYLLAYRARAALDLGRWAEATDTAALVIHDPRCTPMPRIVALAVLGLVRARRGDPDCWAPLDEAWALAEPTGELQRIEPVAVARAEAAWLQGRWESVADATATALDLAVRRRAPWVVGELACWRWRAGVVQVVPDGAALPYALQIAGDWRQAADLLNQLGCSYDAALALLDADTEDGVREAHDEFQRLGARAAVSVAAQRLRLRGARGVPRGPRPVTRQNPAQLTSRELEVLRLVSEGLRNREIADCLHLSEKTVDHHISAILAKLAVRSRADAATWAMRAGIGEPR